MNQWTNSIVYSQKHEYWNFKSFLKGRKKTKHASINDDILYAKNSIHMWRGIWKVNDASRISQQVRENVGTQYTTDIRATGLRYYEKYTFESWTLNSIQNIWLVICGSSCKNVKWTSNICKQESLSRYKRNR